jgi:hypothetical protein cdiviTM7_00587
MAEYKVAQDVEAEDKLIGPFSFRQFIYLIIAAVAVALAWGLGQVFIGLAIIPLPVIIFFTVLALPLRKDQPMEIYVAAIISYRLKPRKRVWSPDGIESLIEITVPKAVDEHLTKDLSQMETEKRLSYLADIADTKGWSIRHTTEPTPNSSMVSDQYYAAQQTVGMLDEDGSVARKFDAMISRADQERHDRIIQNMYYQAQTQAPTPQPTTNQAPNDNVGDTAMQNDEHLPKFNPYPTIHQSVIQPTSQQSNTTANSPIQASSTEPTKPAEPTADTSATAASDDIISLANNSGLSIAALQHEVDRVKQKKEDSEVFISLR